MSLLFQIQQLLLSDTYKRLDFQNLVLIDGSMVYLTILAGSKNKSSPAFGCAHRLVVQAVADYERREHHGVVAT